MNFHRLSMPLVKIEASASFFVCSLVRYLLTDSLLNWGLSAGHLSDSSQDFGPACKEDIIKKEDGSLFTTRSISITTRGTQCVQRLTEAEPSGILSFWGAPWVSSKHHIGWVTEWLVMGGFQNSQALYQALGLWSTAVCINALSGTHWASQVGAC